jgi:hypothetical protein
MDTYYSQVIADLSRKILKTQAFDAAHDYKHHKTVADNCLNIIRLENLQDKVNLDVLISAAYWHDFERGTEGDYKKAKKDNDGISRLLKKENVPENFINQVNKLIDEHSFHSDQVSLEGKILFDADKLEYVSLYRFKDSLNKLPPEKINYYRDLWKSRINTVRDRLFFESSKNLFDRRLNKLKAYIKEERPDLLDWLNNTLVK